MSRRLTPNEHYTVIMLCVFGTSLCAAAIGFIAALMTTDIRREKETTAAKFSTEQKQPPSAGSSRKIYQCSFFDKECVEKPRIQTPKVRPTFRDI